MPHRAVTCTCDRSLTARPILPDNRRISSDHEIGVTDRGVRAAELLCVCGSACAMAACWRVAVTSTSRAAGTVFNSAAGHRRWCSAAAVRSGSKAVAHGDAGAPGGDVDTAGAGGTGAEQPLMPGAYPATRRWSDNNTFVPAPDTAAAAAAAALQVPVIDFGPVSRVVGTAEDTGVVDVRDPAQRSVVDQVAAACQAWGFFSLGAGWRACAMGVLPTARARRSALGAFARLHASLCAVVWRATAVHVPFSYSLRCCLAHTPPPCSLATLGRVPQATTAWRRSCCKTS